LWSRARFDLHLTDEEFWELTPREITWLLRRWKEEQIRQDRRSATIAWILAESNRNRTRRARPFSPDEFLTAQWPSLGTSLQHRRNATADEQMAILSSVMQAAIIEDAHADRR